MNRPTKHELWQALEAEQACLWGDLDEAMRWAQNGRWSMACDNLVERIIDIARLVGATPWEQIPVTLLRPGTYERILTEATIDYPPIEWSEVTRTEAMIAKGAEG